MEDIKVSYIPRAMRGATKCGPHGKQKIFTNFIEICSKFLIPSKYPNKNSSVNTEKSYPAAVRRVACL